MLLASRRTRINSDCKSGGRTVGGTEPGSGGYGLYAGKGWSTTCACASVTPAMGTLKIPSIVAKTAAASVDVCRRIGVSLLGLIRECADFKSSFAAWVTETESFS